MQRQAMAKPRFPPWGDAPPEHSPVGRGDSTYDGLQSTHPFPDTVREMSLAAIVFAITLGLSAIGGWASPGLSAQQPGQTQSNSEGVTQTESTKQKEKPAPAATKPCSAEQSKSQPNCKTTPSKPKKTTHKAAKSSNTAPGKTVVRNGGTGEPSVAISSEESQRQAARIRETNRLLDAADLNLKDVAVRGVNPNQEITIKQIRSYMDQAKAAENSGDVERAYNLANKANMLAADLNGR
jgi:cytoskeletal protein RodZ